MRRERQIVELQIKKLAEETPELLDDKSKEIIRRIDTKNLKRTNQLASLSQDGKCNLIANLFFFTMWLTIVVHYSSFFCITSPLFTFSYNLKFFSVFILIKNYVLKIKIKN